MQTIQQLYALSKRNIILRYKNSFAGFLWGFFKPLLYLLIFIVIFSAQFMSVSNYVLFATSGLIVWFFFSNVTTQSVQNIVSSAGLIKAIRLPAVLFPLSEMMSELFNLCLSLLVYFVIMYWFGMTYNMSSLFLVPAVLLFAVFTFGLTLLLSSLNVFFRDIGILWSTIQPAIFYMTPIAYPEEMIPDRFRLVIEANPVYYFIRLCRTVLYEAQIPDLTLWISCIAIAFSMLTVGVLVFRKLQNQFISAI